MKEIKFTIRLYGWKDITKWFWDRLCYPRREQVAIWVDVYSNYIKEDVDRIYYENEHVDLSKIDERRHYLEFYGKMKEVVDYRTRELAERILSER